MNDLSHIGRPGADEERRIASARWRICHCSSVLLNEERGAENISGPGGPRKSLKGLNSDKEIQGKPSPLFGFSLRGLGPIWLNLDSAWIGLGPISTCTICTIWKASVPIAAANPIANAISAKKRSSAAGYRAVRLEFAS